MCAQLPGPALLGRCAQWRQARPRGVRAAWRRFAVFTCPPPSPCCPPAGGRPSSQAYGFLGRTPPSSRCRLCTAAAIRLCMRLPVYVIYTLPWIHSCRRACSTAGASERYMCFQHARNRGVNAAPARRPPRPAERDRWQLPRGGGARAEGRMGAMVFVKGKWAMQAGAASQRVEMGQAGQPARRARVSCFRRRGRATQGVWGSGRPGGALAPLPGRRRGRAAPPRGARAFTGLGVRACAFHIPEYPTELEAGV